MADLSEMSYHGISNVIHQVFIRIIWNGFIEYAKFVLKQA